MAVQEGGFFSGLTIGDVFGGALSAYNANLAYKQSAKTADAAQQNAQAALNQATATQLLTKNKTTIAVIIGVVAVVVAWFMFKK